MVTRKKRGPTGDEFRIRFLRALESLYSADRTVARILKDESLRNECARLLWFSVNNAKDQLRQMSKELRRQAKSKVEDAIRGADAMSFVYTILDSKPHLAESITTLKADLLEKRNALANAPPSLEHGRNLDWAIVGDARDRLSKHLNREISSATLANLLNAAFDASDQHHEVKEDAVRRGLERFHERQFERFRPIIERTLSDRSR